MRHVFILNPAAGKSHAALALIPEIKAFFARYPMDYAICITEFPGQATLLAAAEVAKGLPVRLYACGGDGTMLEVANGIRDADYAELACIPCGSANDFIRFMPHRDLFRRIGALVMGTARRVDAIRCNDRLSLNLCSMGMDADVAYKMADYKNLPLVSGPMAYQLAIVHTFFRPLGQTLHVVMNTVEGKIERTGKYLFALAANGQYYGGGYHGSPLSDPEDGLLDFVLIKKMSHLAVPVFLSKYKHGQHLLMPFCETFRGTSMQVVADGSAVVNADGECFRDSQVSFTLLPKAVSFVFPAVNADEMLKNYEMLTK